MQKCYVSRSFLLEIFFCTYTFLWVCFLWGMLGSLWVGGVDKGGYEGNPGDPRARDHEQRAADRHTQRL